MCNFNVSLSKINGRKIVLVIMLERTLSFFGYFFTQVIHCMIFFSVSVFDFFVKLPSLLDTYPREGIPLHVKVITLLGDILFSNAPVSIFRSLQFFPFPIVNYGDIFCQRRKIEYKLTDNSGQGKEKKIDVFEYRNKKPIKEGKRKALCLNFHGGSFVLGFSRQAYPFFKRLISECRKENIELTVLAPNYSKIPSLNILEIEKEAIKILEWAVKEYNLADYDSIVFSSFSSGSTIQNFIVQNLVERNYEINGTKIEKSKIKCFMAYPGLFPVRVTDLQNQNDLNSYEEQILYFRRKYYKKGVLIRDSSLRPFNEFNNAQFGKDKRVFCSSKKNFPSHLIVTCEYDYLRKDGECFFKLLQAENRQEINENQISLEIHNVKQETHEFLINHSNSMAFIVDLLSKKI